MDSDSTKREYIEKIANIWMKIGQYKEYEREECAHKELDNILCDLLKELGFGEVVYAYDDFNKWYD